MTRPPVKPRDLSGTPSAVEEDITLDAITQNIDTVIDFYTRAEQNISVSQRRLERVSAWFCRPAFLGFTLAFVVLWIALNVALEKLGFGSFDLPPYHWLQGLLALCALLATAVVLSRQERLAGLADRRAHLDLKLMLLTEKKAAKMIELLEELRRDLPNVNNRHDDEASSLKQAMSPDTVLSTLETQGVAVPAKPPSVP